MNVNTSVKWEKWQTNARPSRGNKNDFCPVPAAFIHFSNEPSAAVAPPASSNTPASPFTPSADQWRVWRPPFAFTRQQKQISGPSVASFSPAAAHQCNSWSILTLLGVSHSTWFTIHQRWISKLSPKWQKWVQVLRLLLLLWNRLLVAAPDWPLPHGFQIMAIFLKSGIFVTSLGGWSCWY